jgi:hypothetical protein
VRAVRDQNGITVLAEDEFIKPQSTMETLGALKPSFEAPGKMGFDAVAIRKYPQVERIRQAEGKHYAPHPAEAVVARTVEEFKRCGKAAGAGFYEYPQDGGRKFLWPALHELLVRPDVAIPFEDARPHALHPEH